jgi:superfamily II DNA or RNA helicase
MTTELLFRKPSGFSFVFINGEIPENIRKAMDLELSYTVQNADYAIDGYNEKMFAKWATRVAENRKKGLPAPQKPEPWDGKVRFLNVAKSGSYYFPIGLLPRVLKLLKWYDVTVKTDLHYNSDGTTGLFEWSGPELRDYQLTALSKLIKHEGGVASMPTGSGKTLLALRMIYTMSEQTLVLVHRKELFKQWCVEIEKAIPNVVPMDISDAVRQYTMTIDDNEEHPKIVVAMVPTLAGAERNKNAIAQGVLNMRYNLMVLDEAHHCPADTFYSVASRIDARYKYGFSATTKREDGDDMKMEAALGPVCVDVKAETLIDSGHLARPVFEFIDVDAGARGKTWAEAYKNGIVLNESRNNAIAARVAKLVDEGRQVYIHVERINHGKILSKLMKCPFVYSKSKDRTETIDTFRQGLTRVLISTLLGEGVDIPTISAIVMAGGHKTEIGTIQKVGRALRPTPGVDNAIVVDFSDKGKWLSEHTMARYNCYVATYGEDIVRGFKKPEEKK